MQDEWRDLVTIVRPRAIFAQFLLTQLIQGSILLAVNVAFLAIPSVDTSASNPSPDGFPRNAVQIASYISIIFTMGCMVTGQLLLWGHASQSQGSAADVVSPLPDIVWNLGFEELSIASPRTTICVGISSRMVVCDHLQYCIVFRRRSFSGRKHIPHDCLLSPLTLTTSISHLTGTPRFLPPSSSLRLSIPRGG
jgi:hypothetical protein